MIQRKVLNWMATTVQQLAKMVETETSNILASALSKNDGFSGTFTTTDGKTVTVVAGQITNIS